MGHVIGIGKMEGQSVPELPRSVSTVRREPIVNIESTHSYSVKHTRVDEGQLEIGSYRDICVTVLNVDQLNKAARSVVESKASSRIRRWCSIAVITWATTATIIAVMQYRTIQELEVLSRQQVQSIEQIVRSESEIASNQ